MDEPYAASGKSIEVLREEMYDLLAWVRDHDWSGIPEHQVLSITRNYDRGDHIVQLDVQRFWDGRMHVDGPGVCADIDMEALERLRPPRRAA